MGYANQTFQRGSAPAIFAAIAIFAGCAGSSQSTADAAWVDSGPGEDVATSDLGQDTEQARADLPSDAPADRQAALEDLPGSGRDTWAIEDGPRADLIPDGKMSEDTRVSDLLTPEDGPVPDGRPSDGTGDRSAADTELADVGAEVGAKDSGDAGMGGDQAACTGWTTLVRLLPAELSDLMTKIDPIIINVHIPYEGDIPGTDTSIPYNQVDDIETYLHKDHCADVVLVCKTGGMSKTAGDELVKRGYLRVRDLDGGMQAWQAAGYPLLKDGGS